MLLIKILHLLWIHSNMQLQYYLFLLLASMIMDGQAQTSASEIKIADGLSVIKLKDNIYQHISDFEYQSTVVKCNGLIYINEGEAIICDTPTNDKYSAQLLSWLKTTHPGVRIKAIIVNHFHEDCLGGLKEFHKAGIKSYGHMLGPELMKLKGDTHEAAQNLFEKELTLQVGQSKIHNFYPGEAHTRDNIITWIPEETTIFGGCMVKAIDATKGNLADANVEAWPTTIKNVKFTFPGATLVIPGHGDAGGQELLDYTIKLFE
jgi:metallo-beta-lactamase class B